MVADVVTGVGYLLRGLRYWAREPKLMLLGIVPAVLVAIALGAALTALALAAPGIGAWLTPFADSWEAPLRELLRLALAVALVLAVVAIAVVTFTTLTLVVGDPAYAHIWRRVEAEHRPQDHLVEPSFWRGLIGGLGFIARAIGAGLVITLVGLFPVAGGVLSFGLGVLISGRLVAHELTARALDARGLSRSESRALLRQHRAVVHGFGGAVHLSFLIPLGAILLMPAAVVGATLLAQDCTSGNVRVARPH